MAEERAPGRVLFDHELTDLEIAGPGVAATVHDRTSDERFTVRARYVVGADGGKTLGARLGVEMSGPTSMAEIVSTHISADMSRWVDDESLITWFIDPHHRGVWSSGVIVKMGPTWDRHSEEWTVHVAFPPDDPERHNEAALPGRLRQVLRLPDLEMTVHRVSHWVLDRIVADRYRVGPVLLAGDAVHRQPPTTGLGLNSAIQDAHNLCWKLALVVGGEADDALLDSYEPERRPVGLANADWAALTSANHAVIDAGLGISPVASVEENQVALTTFFSDTPLGRAVQARAQITFGTQAIEFQAHDVELGFHYEQGAVVPDGSPAPERDPLGRRYAPTTRPGHRLPHAWLKRGDARLSTHDLVAPGRFALLTGGQGRPWLDAAAQVAERLGLPVDAHLVGEGGELLDVDGRWAQLREVEDAGAVLVRPDHHTGWRSAGLPAEPEAALEEALGAILAARAPAAARA